MSVTAATPPRRVVMVVADPGRESTWALEWALSHAVLEHDELVLLHVDPHNSGSNNNNNNHPRRQSSSIGSGGGGGGFPGLFRPRTQQSSEGQEFLENMRAACEAAQPTVKVRAEVAEMMEGKEGKALAVLSNAKAFAVDLLVIGQRRNSSFLGLRKMGETNKGTDTAEYLIENSKCLCVGVQKKGQNAGYLLNTKTHKNFWLLA
ncbi:hypothetical protein QJS04_geneDACA002271 [Acorus gramineus]|uniref:UspA domain-containing protein n=1 Tax=Acorus gramineus TaxID=55184 RepID=A0AAV9AAC3_ACOGR|nr:hypothetical protein QJS04_geneDACA002271 [Acorus gramineus]